MGSSAEPAFTDLTALVDRATPEELTPLATILARIAPGPELTIQELKCCATSDDTVNHNTALTLLPSSGQGQEDILRLLLKNGDHFIQKQAIERIAGQEALPTAFVEDLEQLLDGQPEATSLAAFRALRGTNNLSDTALTGILDNPGGTNYADALYELQRRPGLAETRYDEFVGVLQDGQQSSSVRWGALSCLAAVWPDDWQPCEYAADWFLDSEWTSFNGLGGLNAYILRDADSVALRISPQ